MISLEFWACERTANMYKNILSIMKGERTNVFHPYVKRTQEVSFIVQ